MAVKTYSKKADGAKLIAPNFQIKEFACKDGSDAILISDELVILLQAIRDHFGRAVVITSGYRTPAYNKKIGGATGSYHTKGMAADIVVSGANPCAVAYYAQFQLSGRGGVEVGCYPSGGYVHVDVRPGKWRAIKCDANAGYETIPGNLFPLVRMGSRGQAVKLLQRKLLEAGFDPKGTDGIAGRNTIAAIKAFQKAYRLVSDGICGSLTWAAIVGNFGK